MVEPALASRGNRHHHESPRGRVSGRIPGVLLAAVAAAAAAWLYLALFALGPDGPAGEAPAAPERLRARALASFAHDPTAYTQGLLWEPSGFIESGGGYGRSFIRRWRPSSPLPLAEEALSERYFAEGIAAVGERVIQLTWREGVALYRDRATLAVLDRRDYPGEGWGLCWDGARLVMSDGTDTLTLRDAESFASLGRVAVRAGATPLSNLNELECAEGWVYANVYGTETIARIDGNSGRVAALIDASGLLTERERAGGAEVLNGIAYNPESETFYLTGKLWPRVFEVVFEPAAAFPER